MKNKKLHIIFLDLDDIQNPLLAGGQAHATQEVGKRLVKKGHSVTIICSKYPGSKDQKLMGIIYKHIGLDSKNIKLNNILYILTIPFIVATLQADIIIECFTAPISTLMSPIFTKIPVVGLPTSFDAERFSKLYHFPFWIVEKFGSKVYKYFIALTPYLEEKMQKYNPKIVSKIIGQGVDKEFLTNKNKTPKHILFVGRLDMQQKGLDLLIDAYAQVVDSVKFPLVIAGDGPDKSKLQSLIKRYKLEKHVRLVGFVNRKQELQLLAESLFVAFPSRNEGFSLFSLEAIASGHKLVCFDIPSLSFTSSEIARKVKPFDKNAYAKALLNETQALIKNSAEKECRDFAKKYSWEKVTNQFENFFQEILRNKHEK